MNEELPPPAPEPSTPPPFTEKVPAPSKPPHFGAMFALGVGLIVLSWGICFLTQSPAPFLLGFVGAFVSLFFKGYRGIFLGYIITIGVLLLGAIIYCSIYPMKFD